MMYELRSSDFTSEVGTPETELAMSSCASAPATVRAVESTAYDEPLAVAVEARVKVVCFALSTDVNVYEAVPVYARCVVEGFGAPCVAMK